MLVGVLSDTHGLLRPEVLEQFQGNRAFENSRRSGSFREKKPLESGSLEYSNPGMVLPELHGVEHILHAGDIGDPTILDRLRQIAPVTAIRGNIDTAGPCAALPATEALELEGCLTYMVHALQDLDLHPKAAGIGVLIYGHSHKPLIEHRDDVLYLNPGSAGPRRFRLPVTVALLRINAGMPSAEILPLNV